MDNTLVDGLRVVRSLIKNHPEAAIEELESVIKSYQEALPTLQEIVNQAVIDEEFVDEYKTWFGEKSPTRLHSEIELFISKLNKVNLCESKVEGDAVYLVKEVLKIIQTN